MKSQPTMTNFILVIGAALGAVGLMIIGLTWLVNYAMGF